MKHKRIALVLAVLAYILLWSFMGFVLFYSR